MMASSMSVALMMTLWIVTDISVATKAVLTTTTPGPANSTVSAPQMMQEMMMEIKELKESLSRIQQSRAAGYDHSSFLAVQDKNQLVAPQGVVRFPIVKHSVAPRHFGYDEKISVFRCPHNGTYVFSVSISVYTSGKYHGYSIVKEGEALGTAYTYNHNGYNACSATVTTLCKRGEDVWVENSQPETMTVESKTGKPHTHFTGFRLN